MIVYLRANKLTQLIASDSWPASPDFICKLAQLVRWVFTKLLFVCFNPFDNHLSANAINQR